MVRALYVKAMGVIVFTIARKIIHCEIHNILFIFIPQKPAKQTAAVLYLLWHGLTVCAAIWIQKTQRAISIFAAGTLRRPLIHKVEDRAGVNILMALIDSYLFPQAINLRFIFWKLSSIYVPFLNTIGIPLLVEM